MGGNIQVVTIRRGKRRYDAVRGFFYLQEALDIRGDTFHPEWNYTVHPRPKKLYQLFMRVALLRPLRMPVTRSGSKNSAELWRLGRQAFDRRHHRRALAHGGS